MSGSASSCNQLSVLDLVEDVVCDNCYYNSCLLLGCLMSSSDSNKLCVLDLVEDVTTEVYNSSSNSY